MANEEVKVPLHVSQQFKDDAKMQAIRVASARCESSSMDSLLEEAEAVYRWIVKGL